VLQTANSLNNALLSPVYSSTGLSDSLYQALVTSVVSSDPLVYGAVIVFDPGHAGDFSSPSARRAPFVFRNSTTKKLQVHSLSLNTHLRSFLLIYCVSLKEYTMDKTITVIIITSVRNNLVKGRIADLSPRAEANGFVRCRSRLIRGSLDPLGSASQTASRMVQP